MAGKNSDDKDSSPAESVALLTNDEQVDRRLQEEQDTYDERAPLNPDSIEDEIDVVRGFRRR